MGIESAVKNLLKTRDVGCIVPRVMIAAYNNLARHPYTPIRLMEVRNRMTMTLKHSYVSFRAETVAEAKSCMINKEMAFAMFKLLANPLSTNVKARPHY